MPLYRERAIVLRQGELSGADRLISFLTEGQGKLKAVARGARRPKSRFGGSLEPLNLVELVFFYQPQRPVLARLRGCELIEGFLRLRSDYGRLLRGFYLLELAEGLFQEGASSPEGFSVLEEGLRALDKGEAEPDLIRWACTWKILKCLGFGPRVEACVVCRSSRALQVFNPGLGGCLCEGCMGPDRGGLALGAEARRWLLRLESHRLGELKPGMLEARPLAEVARAVGLYVEHVLERPLRSARLLSDT